MPHSLGDNSYDNIRKEKLIHYGIGNLRVSE